MLSLLGWSLWALCTYAAGSVALGCRRAATTQRGFHPATPTTGLLFTALSVIFLVGQWNRVHLAWLMPLAIGVGHASTAGFPPIIAPFLRGCTRAYLGLLLVGKGAWIWQLPAHLRPSRYEQLESIRRTHGVSNHDFMLHIASHPLTTRNLQRANYALLARIWPGKSSHELMIALVQARRSSAWQAGLPFFGTTPLTPGPVIDATDERVAKSFPTADALAAELTSIDSCFDVPSSPDMAEAARLIEAELEVDCVRVAP